MQLTVDVTLRLRIPFWVRAKDTDQAYFAIRGRNAVDVTPGTKIHVSAKIHMKQGARALGRPNFGILGPGAAHRTFESCRRAQAQYLLSLVGRNNC